jgi:hypothetical protein
LNRTYFEGKRMAGPEMAVALKTFEFLYWTKKWLALAVHYGELGFLGGRVALALFEMGFKQARAHLLSLNQGVN